jgi:hypothetical protein
MADAPAASAGAPPAKGKGDKILGMDKTGFIVLAAAVGVGMLWFLTKGKSQNQGSGQGGGGHHSPTGLKREHLVIWVRNHGGHGRHK